MYVICVTYKYMKKVLICTCMIHVSTCFHTCHNILMKVRGPFLLCLSSPSTLSKGRPLLTDEHPGWLTCELPRASVSRFVSWRELRETVAGHQRELSLFPFASSCGDSLT